MPLFIKVLGRDSSFNRFSRLAQSFFEATGSSQRRHRNSQSDWTNMMRLGGIRPKCTLLQVQHNARKSKKQFKFYEFSCFL